MKAFGITPERLHHWMNIRWQLPHLANQPFQRAGRSRTKDSDEVSRRGGRATSKQPQRRAHDTDVCEQRTDAGQLSASPEQAGPLGRDRQPLGRGIDQNDSHDSRAVTHRIAGDDEAAK